MSNNNLTIIDTTTTTLRFRENEAGDVTAWLSVDDEGPSFAGAWFEGDRCPAWVPSRDWRSSHTFPGMSRENWQTVVQMVHMP